MKLFDVLRVVAAGVPHLLDEEADGHAVHVLRRRHFRRFDVGVRVHPDQAHPVLEETR